MERIQGWMSLLANVAVLAGIIFLAVEIRQNTRAIVGAASTSLTDQSVEFFAAGLDNAVVARALFKQAEAQQLDDFEAAQLFRLQYLNFRVFENAYLQYRRGLYDDEEWERYQKIIARILLSDSIGLAMWEQNRGFGFTDTFAQEVERIMERHRRAPDHEAGGR